MTARRPLVRVGGRDQQLPAGDTLDLSLATTTEAGLMASADKAKLNGVQNGATANSTDATLLNRANHTGTQPASTITGLGAAAVMNAQSAPHADLANGELLARVGVAGFGGHPRFYPIGATLAETLSGSASYGVTRIFRADHTISGSGLAAYAPVLHMGGQDTWSRFQIEYSTGGVNFAFGYVGDQLGAGRFWTTLNFDPANYSTTVQMQAAITAANRGVATANVTGSSLNLTVEAFANGAVYWRFTAAGAATLNVPANSSQAIPIGAEVTLRRASNANLTIAAASGVVINPPAGGTLVMTQNMTATLKKVATNEWDLIGQTVAA